MDYQRPRRRERQPPPDGDYIYNEPYERDPYSRDPYSQAQSSPRHVSPRRHKSERHRRPPSPDAYYGSDDSPAPSRNRPTKYDSPRQGRSGGPPQNLRRAPSPSQYAPEPESPRRPPRASRSAREPHFPEAFEGRHPPVDPYAPNPNYYPSPPESRSRSSRPEREPRESREPREWREPRETREARPPRDSRDSREPREWRDAREPREGREARKPRDLGDSREPRPRAYYDREPEYAPRSSRGPPDSGPRSRGPRYPTSDGEDDYSTRRQRPRSQQQPQPYHDRAPTAARDRPPPATRGRQPPARRNSMPTASKAKRAAWWQNPMLQAGARTAFTAGAQAAMKSQNDPSPWLGAKGARVATAAIGAALVDGFMGQKHPNGLRHNIMKQGVNVATGKVATTSGRH